MKNAIAMTAAAAIAAATSNAGPALAAEVLSIDILQNRLVTLDTETGAVHEIAFTSGLGLITYDMTLLDGLLYAIEQTGTAHQLHAIDPATGTLAGTVPVQLDGENVGRCTGLAVRDGGLLLGFAPDPAGNRATHLGRLQLDGSITDVESYEVADADFHGLVTAPDGETLFSVDSGFTNDLYRSTLDPAAYTFVGGGGFDAVNDLVFVGDELWGLASIAQDSSELFRLDPETGDVLETTVIDVFPGQSLFTGVTRSICTGDVNGSTQVDFGDLLLLLSEWGTCQRCAADLDGSGSVDFVDLLLLLAAWGPC